MFARNEFHFVIGTKVHALRMARILFAGHPFSKVLTMTDDPVFARGHGMIILLHLKAN
jgi:hypothetical protein